VKNRKPFVKRENPGEKGNYEGCQDEDSSKGRGGKKRVLLYGEEKGDGSRGV